MDGWQFVLGANAVKECPCRKVERWKALSPPMYRQFTLQRVKPDMLRHPLQGSVLEQLRAETDSSYLFAGKNRVGKSLFAWCLARQAITEGKRVAAVNVALLLDQYRAFEKPISFDDTPPGKPAITAGDLMTEKVRWFVLLQEFDKPRATEYASERLFELIDAAFNFQQQIVITSNLDVAGLINHWSGNSKRYGNAIVSRLVEMCNQVNLF